MYYLGNRKPNEAHVKSSLTSFVYPRDQHYPLNEARCVGGEIIANTTSGLDGYLWSAYLKGNTVIIKRDDLPEEHVIFSREGITQLDLTFDQNMRPFFVYVAEGNPYYYSFNPEDSSYSEVALPTSIKFPKCAIDYHEVENIPSSDVIIAYSREGNLCYRLQRERFTREYIIATDPNKSMVWRMGRTKDGRFGYYWR